MNNRKGPKIINISEALKPRKWNKMIDRAEPNEDPKTMIIAPVLKTRVGETAKAKKEVRILHVTKNSSVCTVSYHVTDATKYLASVTKMTQCGNRVIFDSDRSYIQSKLTGQEMDLISESGASKLDVTFLNGETAERSKIIIDSGAADNVMPSDGLQEVPMGSKDMSVNFSIACGKPMANYGRKDV